MASFVFGRAKELIAKNLLDFETATIKMRLCMTNTTVDTEKTKTTLSGFTTIDVCDGSGYVDKTLANATITRDDVNFRVLFDGDNPTWATLGAGTRASQGILVYDDLGGGDATSVPLAWIDFPTTETHDGTDFPVQFNATLGMFYEQL